MENFLYLCELNMAAVLFLSMIGHGALWTVNLQDDSGIFIRLI